MTSCKKTRIFLTVVSCLFFTLLPSCSGKPALPAISAADSVAIVQENLAHRIEADAFFRSDPNSPFVRDTAARYLGIRWYPIDVRYRVHSLLHKYVPPETVLVMGTKGEERKQLRYGYFTFVIPDEQGLPSTVKLNAYKVTPSDAKRYELYRNTLSVWFTDRTTGDETYHVGRYVELGDEHSDPRHVYIIDLNKAFNPYCAYSSLFSCAVPRKEDRIELALRVGEMKYRSDEP